ncbi:peptidyl-prolyl cis-trans isomerase, PpiC-type [Janthinobacterium sp. Marseille]|nr:peptidylprolyl isomerase [Janthinobacterium sp. Marseille]ABR89306.1 peptidyl-prolyl cis-trans isomerase, PpiC-type [Janthinobacterium sp. Marseille]
MKSNINQALPGVRTAIGVLLASVMGMSAAQSAAPDKVVASAGSVTIGQNEITRLLQGMPEAERAAIKNNRAGVENWLRQRVTSEALLREAQSKGWGERPEVKAKVDAAAREVTARIVSTSYLESVAQVPATYPSDAEVKAAYEQGKANFNLPASYRVAQIYLASTGTDAAATTKLRDEAKKLATQARGGDFAALARSRSQDPRSAERGGEVGMLPLEQMLPEVRDAVAKLKVGQVSEPVQSPSGFHIVKLLETQPARTATLEEIKPRLQTALRDQRQQQLIQAHMAGLVPAGSLKIDSAALDAALQK